MTNWDIYNYMNKFVMNSIISRSITEINNDTAVKIGMHAFRGCSSLRTAKFSQVSEIDNAAFNYCSRLYTLVLTYNGVARLNNINAFDSTPIAGGTGYVYVPDNLVNDYKNAANWSSFSAQIKGISEL